MHVVSIALDAIVLSSSLRHDLDPDKLAGLTASVDDVGLLHPVLVTDEGEGKYRLVAGYRRVAAARELGYDTIPAVVLAPDVDVRQVQLVENLQREDLDPLERAMAVHAFMDGGRMSKVEAARKLGVARTTLTDWLDILDVEPRFQHAVIDNFNGGDSPLTLSHIAEAKGLAARLGSADIASLLLDAALQYKLTKAEIREVCRLIRENPQTSIRKAVRLLREMQESQALEEELEELGLGPVETNLLHLMRVLHRSNSMLKTMEHLTQRHLSKETRDRLLDGFRRLEEMARAAQERLEAPVDPAPRVASADKPRNRSKRKARNHRVKPRGGSPAAARG